MRNTLGVIDVPVEPHLTKIFVAGAAVIDRSLNSMEILLKGSCSLYLLTYSHFAEAVILTQGASSTFYLDASVLV